MPPLSEAAIQKRDRELEIKASKASEPLARFRWEQTIGAPEGERRSFVEYAQIVGRSETIIRRYANGYAEWIARARANPLTSYIAVADAGEAERTAVMAAADAAGVAPGSVRAGKASEPIKAAKQAARKAVDEAAGVGKDEEEQRKAAERAAKATHAREQERLDRERERTVRENEKRREADPSLRAIRRMRELIGYEEPILKAATILEQFAFLYREEHLSFPDELLEDLLDDLRQVRSIVDGVITLMETNDESITDEISALLSGMKEAS